MKNARGPFSAAAATITTTRGEGRKICLNIYVAPGLSCLEENKNLTF